MSSRSLLLGALALATALSLQGCTCMGCGAQFLWTGRLPSSLTYPEIRALTVRGCANGRCVGVGLAGSEPEPPVGTSLFFFGNSDSGRGIRVQLVRRFESVYELRVEMGVASPTNGDRYLIEVTDPGGSLVAGLAETSVTYRAYNVNVPEPAWECHEVRLEGNTADGGP